MEIYTIGFTQKSAEQFFGSLKQAGIERLIDVRLNNASQLAAFTKRDDLEYFLRELIGADYHHEPLLAPEPELLKGYRSGEVEWAEYERRFLHLMTDRAIESSIDWNKLLDQPVVLLCTEPSAEHCHRRLVVEHLNRHGHDLTPIHL